MSSGHSAKSAALAGPHPRLVLTRATQCPGSRVDTRRASVEPATPRHSHAFSLEHEQQHSITKRAVKVITKRVRHRAYRTRSITPAVAQWQRSVYRRLPASVAGSIDRPRRPQIFPVCRYPALQTLFPARHFSVPEAPEKRPSLPLPLCDSRANTSRCVPARGPVAECALSARTCSCSVPFRVYAESEASTANLGVLADLLPYQWFQLR